MPKPSLAGRPVGVRMDWPPVHDSTGEHRRVAEWARDLSRLGTALARTWLDGRTCLGVLVVPSRQHAALWITLGAVLEKASRAAVLPELSPGQRVGYIDHRRGKHRLKAGTVVGPSEIAPGMVRVRCERESDGHLERPRSGLVVLRGEPGLRTAETAMAASALFSGVAASALDPLDWLRPPDPVTLVGTVASIERQARSLSFAADRERSWALFDLLMLSASSACRGPVALITDMCEDPDLLPERGVAVLDGPNSAHLLEHDEFRPEFGLATRDVASLLVLTEDELVGRESRILAAMDDWTARGGRPSTGIRSKGPKGAGLAIRTRRRDVP